MYHKLEQRKKLTTIVLNVAAYIPKDLNTADLQKKNHTHKTTNVFVIQEISHKTQPQQDFCNKITFENLHKSPLSVCLKYVNTRNIQCRQTSGKRTRTPYHALVLLFSCAYWVMSLWFHIPPHTYPVSNTDNFSLLTTKVPLRAPPGCQLYQDHESYTGQSSGDTWFARCIKQQKPPKLGAETKQSSEVFNVEGDKAVEQFNKVNLPSLESFKARGDVFFIQCCTSSRSQLRAVL